MSQQLDQSEIDSFFSPSSKPGGVVAVDFAHRGSITSEQMQVLLGLNQMFSQSLSVNLSSWLGANIKFAMVSAERCMFPALLETIDLPKSYFAQLRFHTPDARALISMDLSLLEPIVHLGLGGLNTVAPSSVVRDPTPIDIAIMEIVINTLCSEMNRMWGPFGLQAAYECRLLASNVNRTFPQTEFVLCFTYEVQIGQTQGVMQVAIATSVASMLLRGVAGRTSERVQPAATRQMLQSRMELVPMRTTLRLPAFKVRASEIVNLEAGTVLRSSLPRTTPATFALPGGPAWDAVPAVSDGRIAAKLLKPNGHAPAAG
jgi:flagellar motor switch protein FliM